MKNKLHIFFLTGACGVGKSTLVSNFKKKYSDKNNWAYFVFSDIGLPTKEEKIKKYGSTKAWQKETTKIWIKKMLSEYSDKDVIILEGQINLNFINEGFAEYNFTEYTIILVDCSKETMNSRLIKERKQPKLATPEMNYWREILLKQAQAHKVHIIDTDELDKKQAIEAFEKILKEKKLLSDRV